MSVFSFISMGTMAICNIDTYVYSSMQGTIESIRTILISGRINDGYALLRKYYDSAIINIYSNLYLHDNFSIENFVVKKINDWLQGKEKLPEYRVMSQYIRTSETLKPMNDVLNVDDRYKRLRDRCNDHTHYNFYRNVMLNDNEIHIDNRGWCLDRFAEDVQDVFVLHLGYIFFLNCHYMRSSDHLDALECGLLPEEFTVLGRSVHPRHLQQGRHSETPRHYGHYHGKFADAALMNKLRPNPASSGSFAHLRP